MKELNVWEGQWEAFWKEGHRGVNPDFVRRGVSGYTLEYLTKRMKQRETNPSSFLGYPPGCLRFDDIGYNHETGEATIGIRRHFPDSIPPLDNNSIPVGVTLIESEGDANPIGYAMDASWFGKESGQFPVNAETEDSEYRRKLRDAVESTRSDQPVKLSVLPPGSRFRLWNELEVWEVVSIDERYSVSFIADSGLPRSRYVYHCRMPWRSIDRSGYYVKCFSDTESVIPIPTATVVRSKPFMQFDPANPDYDGSETSEEKGC